MKKYKYIAFDFDGTIGDSADTVQEILERLAEKHHFSGVSVKQFKHKDSLTLSQKAKVLAFVVKIQSEFTALYGENLDKVKPFDGMLPLLSELNIVGLNVAIISSNSAEIVERFFSLHNVGFSIPVINSKGLFGKDKTLRRFMKDNDCGARDILYVGDEQRDVKACNKAGVDIAFVKWGLDGDEDMSGLKIRFTAKSPEELKTFIMEELE